MRPSPHGESGRPGSPDGLPITLSSRGDQPGRQGFPYGRPAADLDRPRRHRLTGSGRFVAPVVCHFILDYIPETAKRAFGTLLT
jgi:hypothetical protein